MKLDRPLVLASSSPRRQYLLREAGFQFTVEKPDVDEIFPDDLPPIQVARYLATLKAESFRPNLHNQIIITADTVVILNERILNKPGDRREAIEMLQSLSGQTHTVMTGVCILSDERETTFDDTTYVTFAALTQDEIEKYIDTFQPYDKAGSYGAQDCLPVGMNPCSPEEMAFLQSIGKESLVDKTVEPSGTHDRPVLIKKIMGSYFNVMGLPIHAVHRQLIEWS